MTPSRRSETVDIVEFTITTGTRPVTDLTPDLRTFCEDREGGLLSVFAPHATAGLAIMELGSGSEPDLADLLGRLMPRDERYRHSHGSPGHGADHLLPALIAPSLVIPVAGGRPLLGTWQSVVLVDLNQDNPTRVVRLSFLPG